jgi:hypothetical protein
VRLVRRVMMVRLVQQDQEVMTVQQVRLVRQGTMARQARLVFKVTQGLRALKELLDKQERGAGLSIPSALQTLSQEERSTTTDSKRSAYLN